VHPAIATAMHPKVADASHAFPKSRFIPVSGGTRASNATHRQQDDENNEQNSTEHDASTPSGTVGA
jgi:hypothetical protein